MTQPTRPPRILSGIQPSGKLHLGNYFGAMRHHVELQAHGECFFFIADYHALTTVHDAATLRAFSRDVAISYLAIGLDPARATFYRQSDVPEVCELTWLLQSVTGMGLLEKAHSYKEKVARGITPSVALFAYPSLMAADILGPRADQVPVGRDQDQHVELARDMAQAFNRTYCPDDDPVFHLPEATFGPAARVPGTSFEKGAILHVATELAGPVDPDAYAAGFRAMVAAILADAAPDTIATTEDLERAIAAKHAEQLGTFRVVSRTLRTVSENPGAHLRVTTRADGVGLEFHCELDRSLFVTHGDKRTAAKMSKSHGNTIELFEEGKPLKKRVMGIETRLVDLADPLDHEEDLVFQLYSLFATADELAEMQANYARGGFGFGRAKQALLARIDEHFAPFRERRRELERNPDTVEDVLRDGARRARVVIGETTARARVACGIAAR